MFIPTWLLIVIVAVAMSLFWPALWDTLKTVAIMLFGLLVLISIPASLYFFSQRETETAWLVSAPWIAAIAWGIGLAYIEGAKTSLWFHEWRVRRASSPEHIERLRRTFAKAITLDSKLWQFREDVKFFPSWYTKTNSDGTAWTNNVIARDEIMEVEASSGRRGRGDAARRAALDTACAVGFDLSALPIETPFLLYRFSAKGKAYAFCTSGLGGSFGHDDDGAYEACGVWVVEASARPVLSMRLSYWYDGDSDTFRDSYVEAFKPGPWLPALLSVVDRVHQDEREQHKRWRKQSDRERAETHFA